MMGKVIMSGIVPQLVAPLTGVKAIDISVGSTVKLLENGVATEYLVVNHGIPSESSLYDTSCDGTWLLRKDIYSTTGSNGNCYPKSNQHTACTNFFETVFDAKTKAAVVEVKIPFNSGGGGTNYGWGYYTGYSGKDGYACKCFLLSAQEVGFSTSIDSYLKEDGAVLSYFKDNSNSKRIANYNGVATRWFTRTPSERSVGYFALVWESGEYDANRTGNYGVRPALILPSNAIFDESTLLFKGVS